MNIHNEDLLLNMLYSDELLNYININNNHRSIELSFPSYWSQNRRVRSVQDVIEETFNAKPVFKYVISEDGKLLLKEEVYDLSNNQETDSNICPISFVEFEQNEKLIRLPCNHLFNKENILNWLEKEKSECPVCRYQLPSTEVRNEENNENQLQTENNDISLNNTNINNSQENINSYNEDEDEDEDDALSDFIDTYEERQILFNRLALIDRLIGHQF
jgi:hypothetical protein